MLDVLRVWAAVQAPFTSASPLALLVVLCARGGRGGRGAACHSLGRCQFKQPQPYEQAAGSRSRSTDRRARVICVCSVCGHSWLHIAERVVRRDCQFPGMFGVLFLLDRGGVVYFVLGGADGAVSPTKTEHPVASTSHLVLSLYLNFFFW